jgi:GNAT superfamily N-acetyltransferase
MGMFECSICHKIVKISALSHKRNIRRNGKFICQSCKIQSYAGRILAKRNKDPKFIEKNRDKLKQYWDSDKGESRKNIMRSEEYKKRLSDQAKRAWEDKEYRRLHCEVSKQNVSDPEFIEKLRESSRRAWEDEEYRDVVISNIDRDVLSENAKKMWKNLDIRNKIIKSIKSRWDDDEWRRKWYDRIMSDEVRQRCAVARANSTITLGISRSIPHKIVMGVLEDLKVKYVEEYQVGFYNFDFFLVDYGILIEVNGDYWHSLDKAIRRDRAKCTYIAKYFPEYKLKTIWEHETKCKNKVINIVSSMTDNKLVIVDDFIFKQVNIKVITTKDADFFLSKYHYLRGVGRNAICFGAFIGDKLIAVCCFASVTRKETADILNVKTSEVRELTRFCIHPTYHKKNFGSYVISRCIKLIKKIKRDVVYLVSFADSTFGHNGTIYKASNWVLDSVVKPSYWYVDNKGYVMHKKTLWDHAKSLKMKESEFAQQYGYTKVHGKEKYKYTYKIDRVRHDR